MPVQYHTTERVNIAPILPHPPIAVQTAEVVERERPCFLVPSYALSPLSIRSHVQAYQHMQLFVPDPGGTGKRWLVALQRYATCRVLV